MSEATGSGTLTTIGVALGTPAYMSPEQATADPAIDHRADIYAVGVVAYELLAGRLPFTGTPQQVLAAHVTETPAPVDKHRPGISPALASAVMRCLAKLPADRWQSAAELLAVLEPLATPSGGLTPTDARLQAVKPRTSRRALWIVGVVLLAVLAAASLALTRGGKITPSIVLGRSMQFTNDAGLQLDPAISPDGKLVAFAAGNSARARIYVRPIGGGRTFALTDDSAALQVEPQWSPDGSQLLFRTRSGVAVVPALGGRARALIANTLTDSVSTASWSPDGREIVYGKGDSILVTGADGQSHRVVATGILGGELVPVVAPGCLSSPAFRETRSRAIPAPTSPTRRRAASSSSRGGWRGGARDVGPRDEPESRMVADSEPALLHLQSRRTARHLRSGAHGERCAEGTADARDDGIEREIAFRDMRMRAARPACTPQRVDPPSLAHRAHFCARAFSSSNQCSLTTSSPDSPATVSRSIRNRLSSGEMS